MTKSNVETFIRTLVNNLIDSCSPELGMLIKEKTFISGGCFKALSHDETVNDFDFYFIDEQSKDIFVNLIKNGLTGDVPFTNQKTLFLKDNGYTSDNAITFRFFTNQKNFMPVTVQFITRFTGTPKEVTSKFDFKHATNFYVPYMDLFNFDYEQLSHKRLEYNLNASHPVNCLKRLLKFAGQGWKIDDTELFKIALTISRLNLTDVGVAKDQIIGMSRSMESEITSVLEEYRTLHNNNFTNTVDKLLVDDSEITTEDKSEEDSDENFFKSLNL